jgi:hypothetical protein
VIPHIIDTILENNEKEETFYQIVNKEIGEFFSSLAEMIEDIANNSKMN